MVMVIAPGANSGISEQLGYIQQNLFHGSPHVHEIKIKFTLSLSLSHGKPDEKCT